MRSLFPVPDRWQDWAYIIHWALEQDAQGQVSPEPMTAPWSHAMPPHTRAHALSCTHAGSLALALSRPRHPSLSVFGWQAQMLWDAAELTQQQSWDWDSYYAQTGVGRTGAYVNVPIPKFPEENVSDWTMWDHGVNNAVGVPA